MLVSRPLYRAFKPGAWEKTFRLQTKFFPAYLPMKSFLIQGAVPRSDSVFLAENNFQGGYRCTLKIVTQAQQGNVTIAEDKLGFEYVPHSPVWMGPDSFSYAIVNCFGQESDAKCIYLIGY